VPVPVPVLRGGRSEQQHDLPQYLHGLCPPNNNHPEQQPKDSVPLAVVVAATLPALALVLLRVLPLRVSTLAALAGPVLPLVRMHLVMAVPLFLLLLVVAVVVAQQQQQQQHQQHHHQRNQHQQHWYRHHHRNRDHPRSTRFNPMLGRRSDCRLFARRGASGRTTGRCRHQLSRRAHAARACGLSWSPRLVVGIGGWVDGCWCWCWCWCWCCRWCWC
jgi:hypothetical protein